MKVARKKVQDLWLNQAFKHLPKIKLGMSQEQGMAQVLEQKKIREVQDQVKGLDIGDTELNNKCQ